MPRGRPKKTKTPRTDEKAMHLREDTLQGYLVLVACKPTPGHHRSTIATVDVDCKACLAIIAERQKGTQ